MVILRKFTLLHQRRHRQALGLEVIFALIAIHAMPLQLLNGAANMVELRVHGVRYVG